MRLLRPRFRLRTLLVLVALVALGLGGELMRWRRVRYLQAAAEYARKVAEDRKYSDVIGDWKPWAAYHAEMRRRFEDAASHPWRGDPDAIPEPETFDPSWPPPD